MIGEWINSFLHGGLSGIVLAILGYHLAMEYLDWRNHRGDKK